jgi:hypothetical protein
MKRIALIIVVLLCIYGHAYAANWYADRDALGANNGTSWGNAWKSFDNIVWGPGGVKAGDILYISGGSTSKVYSATKDGMLTIGASGLEGYPITIRVGQETGHNGWVIFDGNGTYSNLINMSGKQYITIDGETNGQSRLRITNAPINISNELAGHLVSFGGSGGNNVVLRKAQLDTASNGIYAANINVFEFSYLHIYGITNDHLIRAVGSTGEIGNNKIHHCNLTTRTYSGNNSGGPDGIQGTYSIDIYNNVFRNEEAYTIGGQHSDYIQTDLHRIRIFNNDFLGGPAAVLMFNFTPVNLEDFYFYNNVIVRPGWNGLDIGTDAGTISISRVYIMNNTFVDANKRSAINFTVSNTSATLSDFRINNNIFYNSGKPGSMQVIRLVMSDSHCAQVNFDYNLINAGNNGAADPVCNWKALSQLHGQYGTPKFISYIENSLVSNLRLSNTDIAARNRGVSMQNITTIDKGGLSRPVGPIWSIGAYEPGLGGSSLSIPANFRKLN